MEEDSGRAPTGQALAVPVEPLSAQRLAPTGFDPSRGLHILQHSLGVDKHGQGEQYRNHFVTGDGSLDYDDCRALVAAGLMVRQKGGALTGGMDAFFVTSAGKRYVAEHSPPPPKLTRGQRRYREWLNVSDATGETFIEFCRRRDSDRNPQGGDSEAAPSRSDESAGRNAASPKGVSNAD